MCQFFRGEGGGPIPEVYNREIPKCYILIKGGLFFFGGLCLNRLPWCFLGLKRDCSEGKFNLLEIGASRHYLRARRCLLCKWENRGELSTLCFTFYFTFPSRPLFFASVLKVRLPPPGGKSKNKAWRCYLQIWNSEWITDPLTHWLTVLGDAIASKKKYQIMKKEKAALGSVFRVCLPPPLRVQLNWQGGDSLASSQLQTPTVLLPTFLTFNLS